MLGAMFIGVVILLFAIAIFKIARTEEPRAHTAAGLGSAMMIVGGILISALVIWLAVKLFALIDEYSSSGARTLIAVMAFMVSGLLIRWLRK